MSPLPLNRSQIPQGADRLIDGLPDLRQAGSAHVLSEPIRVGGFWFVRCGGRDCDWLTLVDRKRDLPRVCGYVKEAVEAAAAMARCQQLAAMDRRELDRLLARRA